MNVYLAIKITDIASVGFLYHALCAWSESHRRTYTVAHTSNMMASKAWFCLRTRWQKSNSWNEVKTVSPILTSIQNKFTHKVNAMMGVHVCVCASVYVCEGMYVCVCIMTWCICIYYDIYWCTCVHAVQEENSMDSWSVLNGFSLPTFVKAVAVLIKTTWQREYLFDSFEIIKTCLKTVSQTRTTVTPLFKLEPSVSLAVGLPSSSVPSPTSDNTVFFYSIKKDWKLNLNVWNHTARAGLAEKTTLLYCNTTGTLAQKWSSIECIERIDHPPPHRRLLCTISDTTLCFINIIKTNLVSFVYFRLNFNFLRVRLSVRPFVGAPASRARPAGPIISVSVFQHRAWCYVLCVGKGRKTEDQPTRREGSSYYGATDWQEGHGALLLPKS